MKALLTLALLIKCIVFTYSQSQSISISHYLFKDFIKGKVLLKTGLVEEYLLNFNTLNEQVIFQRNGVNLEISLPETVDTVYILDKKFIAVDKVFYQIAVTYPVEFYVQHKSTLLPPGKPTGYGGTTQTGAVTTVSTLIGKGQVNNLKLPDDYTVSPYKKYWIKKDKIFYSANSAKQIGKIFPEKEEAIKQFAKKNKTDFKKPEEVEKLIRSL